MTIYTPLAISEKMIAEFVPTRLYIKRHTITGFRYLGKTIHADVERYKGSGTRWSRHIKKHGKEFVINDWISDWFTDPHDLQEFALFLSEELNIVDSEAWANMKPEYGVEGNRPVGELNGMYGTSRSGSANPFYGRTHAEESKSKMGPRGQTMPDSQRNSTSARMLESNPMNNPESVQKIRDSMSSCCCILCHAVKRGAQNLAQHYDSRVCQSTRKALGLP